MNIQSSFIHPYVFPNLYDLLYSVEHQRRNTSEKYGGLLHVIIMNYNEWLSSFKKDTKAQ